MKSDIKIDHVQFTPAKSNEVKSGLRGWISCILNGRIQLDGISLRKTRSGKLTISFPHRHDKMGNQHFYIRPLDSTARKVIQRQVFQELGLRERSA